jgi:hypothetical protein
MNKEPNDKAPQHHPGARKGEDVRSQDGKEPGRYDADSSGKNRPSGGSTARDSTRINPQDAEAIDPKSPRMPPA